MFMLVAAAGVPGAAAVGYMLPHLLDFSHTYSPHSPSISPTFMSPLCSHTIAFILCYSFSAERLPCNPEDLRGSSPTTGCWQPNHRQVAEDYSHAALIFSQPQLYRHSSCFPHTDLKHSKPLLFLPILYIAWVRTQPIRLSFPCPNSPPWNMKGMAVMACTNIVNPWAALRCSLPLISFSAMSSCRLERKYVREYG